MAKKNKQPNMMENFENLKNLVESATEDVEKKFNKNNVSAGQRFRKTIKEMKILLTVLRKQSLEK